VASTTYDPDPYNYAYAYAMPTSCAAIRAVFNSYTVNRTLGEKYERMYDPTNTEELILTDVGGTADDDKAYVKYTYNVTDPAKWDAAFVTSFSYLLAAKLAPILLGKDTKEIANMIVLYNNSIGEAARLDSYEGSGDADLTNPYVDAR
jgi:hypothetical protein